MQTIQPTFDAYKLPGHNDIRNPVDNAIASIRYIQKTYGDISKVQQANANMPPKGYTAGGEVFAHRRSFDQGGVLEKGWNMVRNDTGAPEHLKPAGATVQFGDVHLTEKVDVDSLGRRLAFELAKGRL
jgi:SLT domain-containing protein